MRWFIVITVGMLLMSGCAQSSFVRPQVASENQYIARHASGWFAKAQEEAEYNCQQYNKKAIMDSTDCNLINPIYGAKECLSIWNCQ